MRPVRSPRPLPLSALAAALLFAVAVTPSHAQIVINEIRTDQPFANDDEYFELAGPPALDLTGLTYLVIGDGPGNSGEIEAVVNLGGQSIPGSGIFLVVENNPLPNLGAFGDLQAPLNFENQDNVTHLLVDGFTGNLGDDLDTNDDCTLDVTPWTVVLDQVSLVVEPNPPVTTECAYGPEVGPDGANAPAHVYRDGATSNWNVGDFNPPQSMDSPGQPNPAGLLSREQAIDIFLGTLNPLDPDTSSTAAYMFLLSDPQDSTLYPGDVVADVDSNFTLSMVNPTYFFWVDYKTNHFWDHRAGFVFVDATNGNPVSFDAKSWPVINDAEYLTFVEESANSPDLLGGNGFLIGNFNEPQIQPVPNPITNNWAIIVTGKNIVTTGPNKDEPDIRGDAARGYKYLNGTARGPMIDSTHIEVLGLGAAPGQGTGTKKSEIEAAVCSLAAGPQCDKLYFFYYGHGKDNLVKGQQRDGRVIITGESGGKRRMDYKDLFALVKKANAKETCVLIMDCFSGHARASFKRSGIKGTLITSADNTHATQRRGNGSPFMAAVLKCATDAPGDLNGDGDSPLPEALTWARAANDSVNKIKPTTTVVSDRRRASYDVPECKIWDEKKVKERRAAGQRLDRRIATACIRGLSVNGDPIAGGQVAYTDITDNDKVKIEPGRLVYEIKKITYQDKVIGDNGITVTGDKVEKSYFYVKNPWPKPAPPKAAGNLKPAYKLTVSCIGTSDSWTVYPWLEAQKRHCMFQLPPGCKKLRITRGAAVARNVGCDPAKKNPKGGVWGLNDSALADSTEEYGGFGAPFAPGAFIFIDELVEADPLDSIICEVEPVSGWNLAVTPSSFHMPAGCDTAVVLLTGTVPDTATVGAYLELSIINVTQADTLIYPYHAMLTDSLTAPLGAGADLDDLLAKTELGMSLSGGTASLTGTVLDVSGNSSVTGDAGSTLFASFAAVAVDSGVVAPVSFSGGLDWDNMSVSSAANGIVLDGVTGTAHSTSSVRSLGDGVTLSGDLSGFSMDFLTIDESIGDGLVVDGSSFTIDGAFIDLSGGVDVSLSSGADLELRNSFFDDDSVNVDPGALLMRTWETLFRVVAANGDSIPGAAVVVVDALGDTVYSDVSDSSGYAVGAVLIDWINAGGTVTNHTPHTIHTSLGVYDTTMVYDADAFRGVILPLNGIGSVTGTGDPPPGFTLRLAQNAPNPFLSRTTFRFSVPADGAVSLKLYDARGRLVATLLDESIVAGAYEVPWQASANLANGIYFYRLATPGGVRTKKLTLLR